MTPSGDYVYVEETADDSSGNEAAAPARKLAPNSEPASPSSEESSVYDSNPDSSEADESSDEDDDGNSEDDGDDNEYDDDEPREAPSFMIPSRTIAAVEHPFMVVNTDKALETFGVTPQYRSIIDPTVPQLSVPIYLHPKDPTSRPIMSHYAASHNVVFKVTVPMRTGRKRKRGSDGPWEGEVQEVITDRRGSSNHFRSSGKLDEARVVRRKLEDNVGNYKAEAIGIIKHTHRYRGMVDFNESMRNNDFMNRFTSTLMSKDVSKFRDFALNPGTDTTPNQAIIAPPLMTQITIPAFYNYSQNPYVRAIDGADGDIEMVNTTSKVQSVGHFISVSERVPTAPTGRPAIQTTLFDNVVKTIKMALAERPIWTRRSIINRICELEFDPVRPSRRIPQSLSQQIVKNAIQYAGYQFKGGPWRDAVVRYGYDPREHPESRFFQSLIFRLRRIEIGQMGEQWQDIRKREAYKTKGTVDANTNSHLFDGKTYSEDGKVWQVCDLTDPMLAKLFADAPVRPACDIEGSGWFHRGLWAKARAIMKCKMRAIQFGRTLADADFAEALAARDETPEAETSRSIMVPTPDLKLSEAEWELVRGKRYRGIGRSRHGKMTTYHFPGNKIPKVLRRTDHDAVMPVADGEDDAGGDVMETIEDEHGAGRVRRSVRFAVGDADEASDDGSDGDGSEYDEDEGSEEEEDDEDDELVGGEFGYGKDRNQDELAEQLRLERYANYTDIEQDEEDEEEQEEEDDDDQGEDDEDQGEDDEAQGEDEEGDQEEDEDPEEEEDEEDEDED